MKRKLVTYLLISALAATVLAGCGKKGGDADAADAAAATETEAVTEEAEAPVEEEATVEEAPVEEDVVEEAVEAATATTAAQAAEAVDEIEDEDAEEAVTGEAAAPEETEDLIVDPGTQYTVRFGGNVYASPDENDANIIDYVYEGYVLTINERLENYWYHVTYWIDGVAREGYIKIQ